MRIPSALIFLFIGGCAANGFSGAHQKNGGPVRMERLGAMTFTDVPLATVCPARQVSWCTERLGRLDCACVDVREAERRVQRMAGETDRY